MNTTNSREQQLKGTVDELFKTIGELVMENKFLRAELTKVNGQLSLAHKTLKQYDEQEEPKANEA